MHHLYSSEKQRRLFQTYDCTRTTSNTARFLFCSYFLFIVLLSFILLSSSSPCSQLCVVLWWWCDCFRRRCGSIAGDGTTVLRVVVLVRCYESNYYWCVRACVYVNRASNFQTNVRVKKQARLLKTKTTVY